MEKVTAEQIRNMSEQEWQDFRNKSWKKKQEMYSQSMPDWYLKDKNGFIDFLNHKK
ncbi:MAG: hypothetical protein LBL60_01650 [Mycoplasmataceae bacterium]|jgi:hypothetical protein|nr:hypothetical protein [Mycoplasmataceae bacterium]